MDFIVCEVVDPETRNITYEVIHETSGAVYAEGIRSYDKAKEVAAEIVKDIGYGQVR